VPRLWKTWLQLLGALAFVAIGLWMLADTLRDPTGAEAGQLWIALAVTLMFGGCAGIFVYELHNARRVDRRVRGGSGHRASSGPLDAVYSNVWAALALAGSTSFAVAGVMMFWASLTGGMGWAGLIVGPLAAIVFGSFAVLGAVQLPRSGRAFRRIRIDAAGIHDSRIGGTIGWAEIAWIADRPIYGQPVIEVGLSDPDRFIAALGRVPRALAQLNHRFGYAPYAIALAGLSVGEAELAAAIHRFRPAHLPVLLDD
jgi:hypothetical protein